MLKDIPAYWWPFLYQYGMGAVIFGIGLFVIIRARSCNLERHQDRVWLTVLVVGFLWYGTVHLAWYLVAIYVMPSGTGGPG